MILLEIDTILNANEIFLLFKKRKNVFFLDSGDGIFELGKFSFIGFDPFLIFKSKNNFIEIKENNEVIHFQGNQLEKLREIYRKYSISRSESRFPFTGGGVGFFSYDLVHEIEKLPRSTIDDLDIPDIYFGFYNEVIIINNYTNKKYISNLEIINNNKKRIEDIINVIKKEENNKKEIKFNNNILNSNLKSNFTKEQYLAAVKKIKNYIQEGDIYQVNLSQRFEINLNIDPVELYLKLKNINPAPFSSYIDFNQGKIVSSSPERFIKIKNNIIQTRPIKGTIQRGKNQKEDEINKNILLNSKKDKAELLMIVDLERNDLSKIAKVGTVKVIDLFKLEEYSTVFHLVATIEAEIDKNYDFIDCIKATFPGGSITGVPKIRAMEIIDELESVQRNVYTGSLGYLGFNGNIDLNIVIRTIICKNNKAYFNVGGGIVWDSVAELEYEETLHKAKALMLALGK